MKVHEIPAFLLRLLFGSETFRCQMPKSARQGRATGLGHSPVPRCVEHWNISQLPSGKLT
jgi:hypothetical protein